MTLVIQTSTSQAFPVVERNTFLTVCVREVEAPTRRSSSVPARLRDQYDDSDFCKSSDTFDSEAVTDVCTEASDETPASFSDSGITTEDGEISTPILEYAHQDWQDTMPVLCLPVAAQRTPLSSKAASWGEKTPLSSKAASFEPPPQPLWKVGAAKNNKCKKWWQDSASQVVQKLSFDLGKVDYISQVESIKEGEDWTVTIRSTPEQMYQYERILTVAKESIMKAGDKSPCMYVLGRKWTPFQATPMGFAASLGSMRASKKACWDTYDQGVCPRGCTCLWEHPAYVTAINVVVDFGLTQW
jgi:hypothetical protein